MKKETKLICLIVIFFIISSINIKAQNACPLNFDDDSLKVAKINITKWDREIICMFVECFKFKFK